MKVSQLLRSDPSFDEGEWVPLADFTPHKELRKLSVLLRPSDHPKYRAAYNQGLQPHMKLIRMNKLGQEVYDRVSYVATAKQLIMDIKGLEDEAGNPLTFDRETVIGWASLETYPPEVIRFFAAVSDAATFLASTSAEERALLGKP